MHKSSGLLEASRGGIGWIDGWMMDSPNHKQILGSVFLSLLNRVRRILSVFFIVYNMYERRQEKDIEKNIMLIKNMQHYTCKLIYNM